MRCSRLFGEIASGSKILPSRLLTRPAAVALAFTMIVAIVTVHIDNGLFMSNNGYEFGLALLAASVSLALSGGGRFSADQALNKALQ